jgi:hypothetical protein
MGNALVIVEHPAPPAELATTLELAADFARASKAKTTLAAYRSDWRVFEGWCQERSLAALAASPEVVCGFLADEATRGKRASTLGRRLAAIRYFHRAAGLEAPTGDEKVKRQSCQGSGARLARRRSARKPRRVTSCSAWSAARAPRCANFATAPSCCLGSLVHSDDPSSWPLT